MLMIKSRGSMSWNISEYELSSSFKSPWYNRHGWLGLKNNHPMPFPFLFQKESVGFMIMNLGSVSRDRDVRPATGEIYAYTIEPYDYARFDGKPEVLRRLRVRLFYIHVRVTVASQWN